MEMARGVHLEALFAALTACRLGSPDGVRAAATAALAAPAAATGEETAADLLLAGFGILFAHGHAAAQSPLRSAVDRLRRSEDPYLLTLGAAAARELWDDEAVQALSTRAVAFARDTGALGALARALNAQAGTYDVVVGAFDAADGHVQEAREIRTAIAPAVADRGKAVAMLVAAWRGQEDVARALAQGVTLDASARGQGMEISSAQHALAVLELGSIRYPQAMVAAQDATDYPTLLVVTAALPELVEAAVRCDERDVAAAAVDRVAESALPAGTRWALGTLAHCGALIADDDEAEPLYREAISELKQSRAVPRLARTHLVYGEWLRRRRRRLDAREELRRAQEMFVAMGASAFAERARIELVATGERAQPRTFAAAERLTPQELRIANLVAEGLSNPQIAGQLLISRRTVEYHLHKIFRKLGVSSRTQVARELHERPDSVQLN
jgi:DNA-binding CsgD family transcriptional regulator